MSNLLHEGDEERSVGEKLRTLPKDQKTQTQRTPKRYEQERAKPAGVHFFTKTPPLFYVFESKGIVNGNVGKVSGFVQCGFIDSEVS